MHAAPAGPARSPTTASGLEVLSVQRSGWASTNIADILPVVCARRPADDEWPNNTRRTGGASRITDEVSERDNSSSQLRRDLNSLLQSSKSA